MAGVPDAHMRHLYGRAKVGINLHVPSQISEPTELNERAYNLAASGVPQLMDYPALLPARFSENAVFAARTPREYAELFYRVLSNPAEAEDRAALALEEVMARHTVVHRADALLEFIRDRVRNK